MIGVPGEDIVRVLRVLEYVGPRSWIEHTMAKNAVKGMHVLEFGEDKQPRTFIRDAVIAFPGYEVVGKVEGPEERIKVRLTNKEWNTLRAAFPKLAAYLLHDTGIEVEWYVR